MTTKDLMCRMGIDYIEINDEGHIIVISGETTPKQLKR